jgi:predicted MFS family arabinose efflux permease
MLALDLFRERNFAVGNGATLAIYGGLSAVPFFLVVFLQQVAGYTPVQAGLSLLPLTVSIFALSRRFGALADRHGPHTFMTIGPVMAGAGLLLLTRVGPRAEYVTTVLPAVLVFALGMAGTVAPLTATVLASVELGHSGLASGVNNAVARVAGLLAIAALGAVVSASFATRLHRDLAGWRLAPAERAAIAQKPLIAHLDGAPATVDRALTDASVHAFHVVIGVAGGLAMLGGVAALVGIRNPRPGAARLKTLPATGPH